MTHCFLRNHSMFPTHFLFVVSSHLHVFLYSYPSYIFTLAFGSLQAHFLISSTLITIGLFFQCMVIQSFITIFQKIKTTPNFGPTNLIHILYLSGTSINMLNRLALRTSLRCAITMSYYHSSIPIIRKSSTLMFSLQIILETSPGLWILFFCS